MNVGVKSNSKLNKNIFLIWGVIIGILIVFALYDSNKNNLASRSLAPITSCPIGASAYPYGTINCFENSLDGSLHPDCLTTLNAFSCGEGATCCITSACQTDYDCGDPPELPKGEIYCNIPKCIDGFCIEKDVNEGNKCKETKVPENQIQSCTQNVCRSGECVSENANERSACTNPTCGFYCTTVTGICNSGLCKGELIGSGACDGQRCTSNNPKQDDISGFCISESVCVPCFKDSHCSTDKICKDFVCVPKPLTSYVRILYVFQNL